MGGVLAAQIHTRWVRQDRALVVTFIRGSWQHVGISDEGQIAVCEFPVEGNV